ncbi:hypothetical protein [Myxococcus sp. RHSTA-1-4]|uniref:hypothetical protein n=1 Tax=Myxococcus sp. RHSTA-1-4 TaxID=2874601 RepID=UPI001CBD5B1C|nr:hypothetical protein [Myxococcus sp. RHSTA-1-4]MBZ4417975.1 hypothetical protein [Myxococcus sp. RHSTA-1-4]
MPWFDLDELYYDSNPAESVVALRNRLTQRNRDALGVELLGELSDITNCLQLIGGMAAANEVIAIHSNELAKVKGWVPVANPGDWMGLDVVLYGGGSLLREGIFGSDFFDPKWGHRLNCNGLFSSRAECEEYLGEYRRGVEQGRLESVELDVVDFVDLYRMSAVPLCQRTVPGA